MTGTSNGSTDQGRGGHVHVRVALEFHIPSDVRYIEQVVALVARQCRELHFHPRQVALNVPVALTEALSNAILRGNEARAAAHVQVRAQVDEDRLIMEVVDEGSGFDLAECLVDPTRPENVTREDGRGLYLMSRLMDRVERYTNHGNVVRMTLERDD
ncbi:MAG TPA: ATP-binding protein [Gemmatimonadaceae bacterium]|nr:ATP-binding protein [Gemmatimonadaceae bacterium]